MKILVLLVLLQLSCLLEMSDAVCSDSRCRNDPDEDCTECYSSCDCDRQNCNLCHGGDACCQSCCDNRKRCYGSRCNTNCDCRKMSCSSCSVERNDCCDSCCKCKTTKCNRGCGGCDSVSCNSCPTNPSPCCNTCCETTTKKPEPAVVPQQACCSPNITLPNITIVINQSPIYINNTAPTVNVNNHCGNHTAVQGNGTHIIYVYANSTSCPNRTCCRVPVRRPCIITPMRQPYYYCPPPQMSFQCGSPCYSPPPPQPQCFPTQTWPYYQCPTAGCVGAGCYQEQNSGCYSIPQWPYVQCPQQVAAPPMPYGGPVYGGFPPSASSGGGGFIPIPQAVVGGEAIPEGPMGVPIPIRPSSGGYMPPMGGGGYYQFPPGRY